MKFLVVSVAMLACLPSAANAQVDPNAIVSNLKGLGQTFQQLAHVKSSRSGIAPSSTSPLIATSAAAPSGANGFGLFPAEAETETAADSQLSSKPLRPGDVWSFDILGLKLGMTVKEARRVAVEKHFHPAGYQYGMDWNAEVDQKINGLNAKAGHKIVNYATPKTEDGGSLTVLFESYPDGAHIYDIAYSSSNHGRSAQEVFDALVAKYGKPTSILGSAASGVVSGKWCRSDSNCADGIMTFLVGRDDFKLSLEQGQNKFNQRQQAIADQAHAIERSKSSGVKL